jgi:hypothetical protein
MEPHGCSRIGRAARRLDSHPALNFKSARKTQKHRLRPLDHAI